MLYIIDVFSTRSPKDYCLMYTTRNFNFQKIIFNVFKSVSYPSPLNISYLWNFGSLAAFCLFVQILTGIVLAMHYTPYTSNAFTSIEYIMRQLDSGWFLRYCHANGASMFFIIVYLHIIRGLYYGSYIKPTEITWSLGIVIFFLMMTTGFLGYILPWGQMSFWGATVITNFITAIPVIGESLLNWIWGGFSVNNATLNRFFSLHYLLPFIIGFLALTHTYTLHLPKSNNPLGTISKSTFISFHPYFSYKDILGLLVFIISFSFFIFFLPHTLGDPTNYIAANPLITPTQIIPEWYFLPFYTILRSIPSKIGGIIMMGLAILILSILPVINTTNIRSSNFRPLYKLFYWGFITSTIFLGWLGSQHAEEPFVFSGQIATIFYFLFFTGIIVGINLIEKSLIGFTLRENK